MTWGHWVSLAIAVISLIIWVSLRWARRNSRGPGRPGRVIEWFDRSWFASLSSRVWLVALVAVLIYPIQVAQLNGLGGLVGAVIGAFYVTMQVFVAGVDIAPTLRLMREADGFACIGAGYALLLSAAAPILTVTLVVSLIGDLWGKLQYARRLRHRRRADVFSELNENSLALAESIRKCDPESIIVFTNVLSDDSKFSTGLQARADRLKAICLRDDAFSPALTWRRKRRMRFFVMGSDPAENLRQAYKITSDERYTRRRGQTDLYLFSDSVEGRLIVTSATRSSNPSEDTESRANGSRAAGTAGSGPLRVRRINIARTMVYNWLWQDSQQPGVRGIGKTGGIDLFSRAATTDRGDRLISAVILGLGEHGMEMLKALTWFCQMDTTAGGQYLLKVDGFDTDPHIAKRFRLDYPGLAKKPPVGRILLAARRRRSAFHWLPKKPPVRRILFDDAHHDITIHPGIDATSAELAKQVLRIANPTLIFVSLGDDGRNLQVAIRLQRELARKQRKPIIMVVSRHADELRPALQEVLQADGAPPIDLVGGTGEIYTHQAIIQSDMESAALASHLHWVQQEPDLDANKWWRGIQEFFTSEYHYRSSMAVVLHHKARQRLHRHHQPDSPNGLEGREHLRRLEHARWNAFMRSEGFSYAKPDKTHPDAAPSSHGESRRDGRPPGPAKTHPDLVPFSQLPAKEQIKDENDPDAAERELRKRLKDRSLPGLNGTEDARTARPGRKRHSRATIDDQAVYDLLEECFQEDDRGA